MRPIDTYAIIDNDGVTCTIRTFNKFSRLARETDSGSASFNNSSPYSTVIIDDKGVKKEFYPQKENVLFRNNYQPYIETEIGNQYTVGSTINVMQRAELKSSTTQNPAYDHTISYDMKVVKEKSNDTYSLNPTFFTKEGTGAAAVFTEIPFNATTGEQEISLGYGEPLDVYVFESKASGSAGAGGLPGTDEFTQVAFYVYDKNVYNKLVPGTSSYGRMNTIRSLQRETKGNTRTTSRPLYPLHEQSKSLVGSIDLETGTAETYRGARDG